MALIDDEAIAIGIGEVFVSLGFVIPQLGLSTDFAPSPMRRNCCRFLALHDRDFCLTSLLTDDNGNCDNEDDAGYCSVIGLEPIHGNLVLEEKELLADEEEEGDGVVDKELFIGTTP